MIKKNLLLLVSVFALSLAVGFVVFAQWTEPANSPPAGNAPAPLNVSGTAQLKAGPLTVANIISASQFTDADNAVYYLNPSGAISAVLSGQVAIGDNNPGLDALRVKGGPINAIGGLIIQEIDTGPEPTRRGSIWLCVDNPGANAVPFDCK